ncbi:MAG: hypothetical protein CSA45_03665 [Gammaproteobacteria bacterium]|nr:MAG: hypothetical protein CSA45_03665 [Gammaproteobacteria bacterium]
MRYFTRLPLILGFITLGFIVTGCGFHLRGVGDQLSSRFEKTYFSETSANNSGFSRQLKRLIALNGGHLVAKADAQLAVNVEPISVKSRQVALTSTSTLKEYEYTYATVVTVVDLTNGVQLGSRRISTSRLLQIDESSGLAGDERKTISQQEAARTLAQSVIGYLQSF